MDHERGKDPTPGGRMPSPIERQPGLFTPKNEMEQKYANSAPGPEHLEDGAAFFGFKRENAYPSHTNKQP
ncbi:MAG: hypothetical protein ACOY94_17115 [Bacillota bacterium]